MNRTLTRPLLPLRASMKVALVGYLALFFVLILPGHDLSHAHGSFTDQNSLADSAVHPGLAGHNADQCQICRTHGQLDAFLAAPKQAYNLASPERLVECSYIEPAATLLSLLSPRSPPALG